MNSVVSLSVPSLILLLALFCAPGVIAAAAAQDSTQGADEPKPPTEEAVPGETSEKTGSEGETEGDSPDADSMATARFEGEMTTLNAQILLDRAGFSAGYIDGYYGKNMRGALKAYQRARGLEETGSLDSATTEKLRGEGAEAVIEYTLTEEDVAGDYLETMPEKVEEQAKLERLGYVSVNEKLAERWHLTETRLQQMNPGTEMKAGATLQVPALGGDQAATSEPASKPTGPVKVVISKSGRWLEAHSGDDKVLMYAPITPGSSKYPLPVGELQVTTVVNEPTFTYDPELLEGAQEVEDELDLPPGPNNPVGLVWIGLSKEHYGIHGTADPADIGRKASSGCVRMTNWDAQRLLALVDGGTVVDIRE